MLVDRKLDRKTDPNPKQIRVAVYIRVSTEDQVAKYGLPMQRDAINAYMKAKGKLDDGRDVMVLAGDEHVYIDDGVSGTKGIDERKDFWRLKENIELNGKDNKLFDAVAVYKIDRLARKLKILLEIIDLFDDYDIGLISVNESIDTSTPFGRAILGIMGVIAELEIETIKQRVQGGKIASILRGVYQGTAPYGYKKDVDGHLYEFEEESKHIKDIFRWCVFEDKTTGEIANMLSNNKVVSPEVSAINNQKRKGKIRKINNDYFWSGDTVREIINEEVYIGKFWYGKTIQKRRIPKENWKLSEYQLPRLIEDSVFIAAQQKLRDSANKVLLGRKIEDNRLYLLSGLLKCGWCQKHSRTKEAHTWNGDKKKITKGSDNYSYYYKCGHKNSKKYDQLCPTMPIPAEQLESYVIAFIQSLLRNPKIAFDHQKRLKSNQLQIQQLEEERNEVVKNLNEMPRRKESLSIQHERGFINDLQLEERLETIKLETKGLESRQSEINKVLGQQVMSDGYIRSFSEYSKRYKQALIDIENNKDDVYRLLHSMIDIIMVYTRPIDLTVDHMAGRKKDNQQIPNSILIKLKLPKELLNDLLTTQTEHLIKEFGVRSANL